MQLWKGICRSAYYSTRSKCVMGDLRVRIFPFRSCFSASLQLFFAFLLSFRSIVNCFACVEGLHQKAATVNEAVASKAKTMPVGGSHQDPVPLGEGGGGKQDAPALCLVMHDCQRGAK